jgi:hypothetical protein
MRLDERQFVELSRALSAVLMLARAGSAVRNPSACVQRRLLALDPAPFERIFQFRASDRLPRRRKEANDLFGAYLFQIEQVVEAVDQLKTATQ